MEINPTSKIVEYLKLTRAHTLPLETVPAICGAAVAGASPEEIVIWGFFGAFYHLGGYGMNSVVDWVKGYDKEDENKQHHPLNSGTLDVRVSGFSVLVLISSAVGIAASMVVNKGSVIPAVILAVGFGCAVAYNQIGKETHLKFLLISVAHTTVFVLPYTIYRGVDSVVVLAGLTMFLWVSYQIGVSGEIKDITTDEANVMKALGMRVEDKNGTYYISNESSLAGTFSRGLRYLITVPVVGTFFYLGGGDEPLALVIMLSILVISFSTLVYNHTIIQTGMYQRQRRLLAMSKVEALTLVLFVLSLYPSLGITLSVALIGGSVAWVYALSRIMWGSKLTPKV